jgi:hypothetical protein
MSSSISAKRSTSRTLIAADGSRRSGSGDLATASGIILHHRGSCCYGSEELAARRQGATRLKTNVPLAHEAVADRQPRNNPTVDARRRKKRSSRSTTCPGNRISSKPPQEWLRGYGGDAEAKEKTKTNQL